MHIQLAFFLAAIFTLPAFAQSTGAAKPAPAGQVYRCGNQYLDRPCAEKGGKLIQITANVVASGKKDGAPDLNRKPPSECASLESQTDERRKQARGKSSDQGLADLTARLETVGC